MCTNQECRAFFDDYDRNFLPDPTDPRGLAQNPDLTNAEKRRRMQVIGEVAQELVDRRDKRARAAQNGNPPPDDFGDALESEDVGMLSRLQLPLFFRHFSDGRGGIDFEKVQCCFEKFANGELRDPNNPGAGEPNGDFFFLFAEFALAAMEFGYDRDIWAKLLRTFVKCQEIYISAYPPAAGQPDSGLDRDRPFNPAGQLDEEKKRELRRKYDDKTPSELERLYGDNLKKANEQKPVRPSTQPAPDDFDIEALLKVLEAILRHLRDKGKKPK
jgi:hypothetical protein